MTYARIDDRFDDHPKYVDYGAAEMGLIACAITYANRNRTDGKVPRAWIRRRFGRAGLVLAERLVRDEVWSSDRPADDESRSSLGRDAVESRSNGGHDFVIEGFLDHNSSRADIEARLEADRLRKAGGGRKSGAVRRGEFQQDVARIPDGILADSGSRSSPLHSSPIQQKQKSISSTAGQTDLLAELPSTPTAEAPTASAAEREVFDHWLAGWHRVIGGTRPPILDSKRKTKVKARLADGYSVADLKLAVDGLWASDWHVANRKTDLELVCRDAPHVDDFMARPRPASAPPSRQDGPSRSIQTELTPEVDPEQVRAFQALVDGLVKNSVPAGLREQLAADAERGADVRIDFAGRQ